MPVPYPQHESHFEGRLDRCILCLQRDTAKLAEPCPVEVEPGSLVDRLLREIEGMHADAHWAAYGPDDI